ncbi:MAG: phage holin family protein [Minisyncoccia bacterium]
MKIFLHWLLASVAIGIAAYLVPGIHVTIVGALIAAVVFGAINLFIRPIVLVLTLPINILTLGLFTLVVNALLVMLVALLVPGFFVSDFWTALLFSMVLGIVNWIFDFWDEPKHA